MVSNYPSYGVFQSTLLADLAYSKGTTRKDEKVLSTSKRAPSKEEKEAKPDTLVSEEEEDEEDSDSLRSLFRSLDYPELQVVPRASHRLKMESAEEGSNWWYIHWPFYLSAISTYGLGSTSSQTLRDDLNEKEIADSSSAALAAKAIGASWLIGTMLLVSRKPYQKAYRKIRGYSGSGRTNELLRERISEEALEQAAYQMKVLSYVSLFTNLAAAGYMGSFLNDRGRVFAGVSGFLSFLPLIFDDWYVYNYKKQLQYKRNIFTPVVSLAVQEVPSKGNQFYPNLGWVMEF